MHFPSRSRINLSCPPPSKRFCSCSARAVGFVCVCLCWGEREEGEQRTKQTELAAEGACPCLPQVPGPCRGGRDGDLGVPTCPGEPAVSSRCLSVIIEASWALRQSHSCTGLRSQRSKKARVMVLRAAPPSSPGSGWTGGCRGIHHYRKGERETCSALHLPLLTVLLDMGFSAPGLKSCLGEKRFAHPVG